MLPCWLAHGRGRTCEFSLSHRTADPCKRSGPARGKWHGPAPLGGAETSFGMAAGGGVDAKITNNFSIRMIQAEYVRTQFGTDPEHQFRLATGALFSF